MGYHDTQFSESGSPRAVAARGLHRSYGRAALAAAIENGLMRRELSEVLGGRSVVEAFPVAGSETASDYAHRAVAEIMVAYVSRPFA